MDHTAEAPIRVAALVFLLAGVTLSVGCPSATTQESAVDQAEQRLQDLQQDIDLLGEINRLDLTKEQMAALITQVEAIQEAVRQSDDERLEIMQRLQVHMEAKKAALLKDEGVPDVVERQIDQHVEALQALDARLQQSLLDFVPRLRNEILTGPQVDILTWVSEARMQAMAYLEWARTMSDQDFATEGPLNAENLSEGRDISKDDVLAVFTEARGMSDDEFETNTEALADRLLPAVREETESVDAVLIQRLRPPRLLTVLKEKLAQAQ